MKKRKQAINIESGYFNPQEQQLKYIAGYFGFEDIQVNIAQWKCNESDVEQDLQVVQLYSKDQNLYMLMAPIFKNIMHDSKLDEFGVLTMSTPICFNANERTKFKFYYQTWENKLYKKLMGFISLSLNPRLKMIE